MDRAERVADWYDHALYYDVLFGWDPETERRFVLGASERYGRPGPARVLEPFCGTGRLLRVMPGLAVGLDLNPAMVAFAARSGCRAVVADAARLPLAAGAFDLAYCLIDSFRHLLDADAARAHLAGVARALRPGGVYVLGLDVTGGLEAELSREEWDMTRGDVHVKGLVEGLGDADPASGLETMRVVLDVRHGRRRRRLESRQPLRVYDPAGLRTLVAAAGLELAACFDRSYDLAAGRALEDVGGSAVLVLRRAA